MVHGIWNNMDLFSQVLIHVFHSFHLISPTPRAPSWEKNVEDRALFSGRSLEIPTDSDRKCLSNIKLQTQKCSFNSLLPHNVRLLTGPDPFLNNVGSKMKVKCADNRIRCGKNANGLCYHI